MVVASASLAGLIGVGFGRIGSCWRLRNMPTTASSLSLLTRNIYRSTSRFLREMYRCSLSDSERASIIEFDTLLAANMEKNLEDPIITQHCLAILDVEEGSPGSVWKPVVLAAITCALAGDKGTSKSESLTNNRQPTSQVIFLKNGHARSPQNIATRNSRECPYDRELD